MVKTVGEVRVKQLADAFEVLKKYSDEYEIRKEEDRIVIKGLASQALMRREDIVRGIVEKKFDLLAVKKVADTEIDVIFKQVSADTLTIPYSMWKYRTEGLQTISRKEVPEETELLTGVEVLDEEVEEEIAAAGSIELTETDIQKLQAGECIQKEVVLDDNSTFLITISAKKEKDFDEGWFEKTD
jgi:hypothetical protein